MFKSRTTGEGFLPDTTMKGIVPCDRDIGTTETQNYRQWGKNTLIFASSHMLMADYVRENNQWVADPFRDLLPIGDEPTWLVKVVFSNDLIQKSMHMPKGKSPSGQ